jgi:DNA-binding LacI/PurR family transcriptional regulator
MCHHTTLPRRAGGSPSTVSRALSGAKPVAAATQARVAKAVRELDYRPNAVARALARGRTMSIGVLAYTSPPLTTVCIPTHELGQSAARIALDLLAGR